MCDIKAQEEETSQYQTDVNCMVSSLQECTGETGFATTTEKKQNKRKNKKITLAKRKLQNMNILEKYILDNIYTTFRKGTNLQL